MGQEEFAVLLERMPKVAEAVNAFKSESVQLEAFQALVEAFVGEDGTSKRKTAESPSAGESVGTLKKATRTASKTTKGKEGNSTKKRRGSSPKVVGDLNLRPSAKQSFKDFAAEKAPKTYFEKETVAVYYLIETIGMQKGITEDHVYSCFQDAKWRVPHNLLNSMQEASSRKSWLDTSDGDDIKITTPGKNLVIHDLPATPKA